MDKLQGVVEHGVRRRAPGGVNGRERAGASGREACGCKAALCDDPAGATGLRPRTPKALVNKSLRSRDAQRQGWLGVALSACTRSVRGVRGAFNSRQSASTSLHSGGRSRAAAIGTQTAR